MNKNTEYKKQYNKENYSSVVLYFQKAEKEAIAKHCGDMGINVSEYIKGLVYADIGDVLCKAKHPTKKEILDVNVYFTGECFAVAVCGREYLIFYANDTGFKFGVKLTLSTAPQNLARKFSEKKVNSVSFERWKKIADVKGEFNEDIPDIAALMKNLNNRKYWLIYSSDETQETELPDLPV